MVPGHWRSAPSAERTGVTRQATAPVPVPVSVAHRSRPIPSIRATT